RRSRLPVGDRLGQRRRSRPACRRRGAGCPRERGGMTAASRGGGGRRELGARLGLALVALAQAEIGVWGLLAPHSFYASYPGAGRHWVSALGPYDEHLVRDFAGTELGFAVLLACAAVWFERRLVLVAGAAFLAATLPHI